jgi:hypothetical protein
MAGGGVGGAQTPTQTGNNNQPQQPQQNWQQRPGQGGGSPWDQMGFHQNQNINQNPWKQHDNQQFNRGPYGGPGPLPTPGQPMPHYPSPSEIANDPRFPKDLTGVALESPMYRPQQPAMQPNAFNGPMGVRGNDQPPMPANLNPYTMQQPPQQPQTYQDYLKSMGPIQVVPQTEAQWNASRNMPAQMQQGMPQSNLQTAFNNAPPSNTPYAGQGMQQPQGLGSLPVGMAQNLPNNFQGYM